MSIDLFILIAPPILVAGGLVWHEISKSKVSRENESWTTKIHWPDVGCTKLELAAILCPYAEAAYPGEAQLSVQKQSSSSGREFIAWNLGNASGIIVKSGDTAIVSIAGTQDYDDARNNIDLGSVRLSEFADMHGFRYSGPVGLQAHVGMATHASLCVRAIQKHLSGIKHVFLTGHSLGGAAATLAAWLLPRGANVYSYGAPRCIRKGDHPACEELVRVERAMDPVPWIPRIGFRHPEGSKYVIRYKGSVLPRLTIAGRIVRIIWLAFLFATLRTNIKEHRIAWYRDALEPWVN